MCSSDVYGIQVSKKYVSKDIGQEIHAKAEPFLKWLREAEEEESSEDDEEEEVEVGYPDYSDLC